MKYQILNAAPGRTFTTKTGKGMTEYQLILKGEDGVDVAAAFAVFSDQPAPSGMIEGTIEQTQYGPKFTKAGGGAGPGGRGRSPEERDEIMRQNALTNAVAYVVAKAELMSKLASDEKGVKEAVEYMSGKQVIQVATFFHRYTKGATTVVNQGEQPNEQGQVATPAPEAEPVAPASVVSPAPVPAGPVEIDLDDIPF